MKNTILVLILLTTTLVLHGQTKKKKNVGNETELPTNGIVGTWKLVEFSNLDKATNTWTHPYGRNPNGYFSYSKSGIVNINISSEIPLQIPKDSLDNFKINM
ncbi:MAG: lipocalin-like domain-containing protein, partial [Flammeovirgaceae bacterium]